MKKFTIFALFFVSSFSLGKRARVIYLENENMGAVHLRGGRATVLSFPTKPDKVICGNKNLFSIEFVENDVVITPLSSVAESNLFIYLFGRRFGLGLTTSGGEPDEILVIRDIPIKNEKNSKSSKSY